MELKRSDLLEALAIVKPALANKEFIEQSTSFAFLQGRVVTYNDEISISHPIEGIDFEGAIKADELYQLLSKLKADMITVTVNAVEISIQCGKSKAGLTLQEEIKLPLEEIGSISKWQKLPEAFCEAVKFVWSSCSTDMSRPILTCINVKKSGHFIGSDGFCICSFELTDEMPTTEFLLPASMAQHVLKLNPTKISIGEGWIHFKSKQGTVLSCRTFVETYPNFENFFKVKGTTIPFPKSTKESIERASVFSKRERVIDEEVVITFEENKMKVKSTSNTGWFEEKLNVKYSGPSISFSITPYLLMDILDKTENCILGETTILFYGENWHYVARLRNV